MINYQIRAPHFEAEITVQNNKVILTAPILQWAEGKQFEDFQDYCEKKGWTIIPSGDKRPEKIVHKGKTYELHWNGDVITRVTLHDSTGSYDLRYSEMPEPVRRLL